MHLLSCYLAAALTVACLPHVRTLDCHVDNALLNIMPSGTNDLQCGYGTTEVAESTQRFVYDFAVTQAFVAPAGHLNTSIAAFLGYSQQDYASTQNFTAFLSSAIGSASDAALLSTSTVWVSGPGGRPAQPTLLFSNVSVMANATYYVTVHASRDQWMANNGPVWFDGGGPGVAVFQTENGGVSSAPWTSPLYPGANTVAMTVACLHAAYDASCWQVAHSTETVDNCIQCGASGCGTCDGGFYLVSTGPWPTCTTTQPTCAPGAYAVANASASSLLVCASCPAGTWSSSAAAVSSSACTACAIGTASSGVGATAAATCQPCAVDTYANTTGAPVCWPCPASTHTQHTGATSQSDCMHTMSSSIILPVLGAVAAGVAVVVLVLVARHLVKRRAHMSRQRSVIKSQNLFSEDDGDAQLLPYHDI